MDYGQSLAELNRKEVIQACKDFIAAVEKTREEAKQRAIANYRNNGLRKFFGYLDRSDEDAWKVAIFEWGDDDVRTAVWHCANALDATENLLKLAQAGRTETFAVSPNDFKPIALYFKTAQLLTE